MTGLIIFGCILLFFVFILSLQAKITVEYSDDIRLSVRVLFIRIKILPSKKQKKGPTSMSKKKAEKIRAALKKKALKKQQKSADKKKKKQEKKEHLAKHPEEKKKLSISEILGLVAMARDVLAAVIKTFFGHLRVDVARLHVNIATGDAASTAIAYGAVSQAVLYFYEVLEPLKGINLPDVKDAGIHADFIGESTTLDLKVSVRIRVWHIFHVAFAALGKAIKHLVKMKFKKSK